MSYNKVILLGNLVRDPEMRVTPKGTAICQFGLALNHKYKTDTGEQREEVTFVDLEAWGKTAENIAKYCTKGKPLMVEGRLKLDTWDDKTTGQKRSKLKVVVEQFQFVGGADKKSDDAPQTPAGQSPYTAPAKASGGATGGGALDDIPFAALREMAQ